MRKHKITRRDVRRGFVYVILSGLFGLLFSGCSASEAPAPNKTIVAQETATSTPPAPVEEAPAMNLTGDWAFQDGDFGMKAEVSANSILITLVAGDSSGLYWAGSFVPEADPGNAIVSKAERDLLDKSLFGSQDSKKTFAITEDTIEFPFTMMGVTKTVKLEKQ